MKNLARALAIETHHALKQGVHLADVAPPLAAFLDALTPASYLSASRALKELRLHTKLSQALAAQRARRHADALDMLRATGPSGEVLAAALVNGTRDKKAAERINALACLIGTYEELESRAQAQRDELRQRLGL